MGYFASGAAVSPQLGILSHLAVSAVYGMLFGLILRWTRLGQFKSVPGWFTGLTYALLLWLAAILFILPGPGSLLKAIPVVHFLLAHIVYGLVLGLRQKAQAD